MTRTASTRRIDRRGRAFKGSQLHVQVYVNGRRAQLEAAIKEHVPELETARMTWRAPLPERRYREPRDAEFLNLAGLSMLRGEMADYWPKGGPVWDGLASLDVASETGVLLLEGKSYPEEMKSTCRAESERSRRQIRRAISATRRKLNGTKGTGTTWFETYYQLANRLAHLVWLRERGVPTWLVLLCFVDDDRHVATSAADWEAGIETVGAELGVELSRVEGLVHIFLPPAHDLTLLAPSLRV